MTDLAYTGLPVYFTKSVRGVRTYRNYATGYSESANIVFLQPQGGDAGTDNLSGITRPSLAPSIPSSLPPHRCHLSARVLRASAASITRPSPPSRPSCGTATASVSAAHAVVSIHTSTGCIASFSHLACVCHLPLQVSPSTGTSPRPAPPPCTRTSTSPMPRTHTHSSVHCSPSTARFPWLTPDCAVDCCTGLLQRAVA